MKNRWMLVVSIAIVFLGGGLALADDWDGTNSDPDGKITMAERLSALSHQVLRQGKVVTASDWAQSAALCRATTRLVPSQPRFARALVDNLLNVGDADGALDALKRYRALVPDDQGAQVEQIDLQLRRYESAADKISYLKLVLTRDQIPKPVRSVAAARCAQLLEERSQTRDALRMLDTALQLNPLNISALRAKYELTQAAAAPLDRVNQLLGIMHANPGDPTVTSRLAMQLADLGLIDQSLLWFKFSNMLYYKTASRPDRLFACGAATESLLADKADEATNLMKQYLAAYPGDADAWFIQLATTKYQITQGKTDQPAEAAQMRQAQIALTNLLQSIRLAAGDRSATTRPVSSDTDSPLPDLSGDPARLARSGRPDLADAYISAASSLAWLDLYFRRDAASADPLLDAMANLLSPNDVQLIRLRGWRKYVGGDADGGALLLQLVAKTDPLAELGLVLIDLAKPPKHDEALARGKALLNAHPSGMIGATLWVELSALGATIDPSPAAQAVATQMSSVPTQFIQLVNNPEAFYTIRAEPLRASYEYGDPILLNVLVKNLGNVDIAIGADCALHPELWFDAYLRGEVEEPLTGVAVGRIDQRLVLEAGQSFGTTMRVDQDTLFSLFGQNPALDLTVNMAILTNPAGVTSAGPKQPEQAVMGPCGLRVQLTRMLERSPTPIGTPEARANLADRLEADDGGVRIRTLEVMGTYVVILRKSDDANQKTIADDFAEAIRKAQNDKKPAVRAWARYVRAFTSSSAGQANVIDAMSRDSDWMTRLWSALAAPVLGDKAPALIARLTSDPDPIVRDYAKALSQATAAPTTQPESPPMLQPIAPPAPTGP